MPQAVPIPKRTRLVNQFVLNLHGSALGHSYHLVPAAFARLGCSRSKRSTSSEVISILPHYNWAPNLIADVRGAIIGETLYRSAGNFVRSAFASVVGSLAQSPFASANTNTGMSGNK